MDFWKRAQELNQDTVDNRRYFHAHAEVGLNLPKALQYIDEKLRQYGITPRRCGHGITATIG
ncbi:MAG: amidohydrolase, partial [Candidatus Faecousia sp.]|nr:amidohydrolase [Candidatus Faecousia sp.]